MIISPDTVKRAPIYMDEEMDRPLEEVSKRPLCKLLRFFFIIYVFSFSFYGISYLPQVTGADPVSTIARYCAGAGPLVSALFMVFFHEGPPFRKDYRKRIVDLLDPLISDLCEPSLEWFCIL